MNLFLNHPEDPHAAELEVQDRSHCPKPTWVGLVAAPCLPAFSRFSSTFFSSAVLVPSTTSTAVADGPAHCCPRVPDSVAVAARFAGDDCAAGQPAQGTGARSCGPDDALGKLRPGAPQILDGQKCCAPSE